MPPLIALAPVIAAIGVAAGAAGSIGQGIYSGIEGKSQRREANQKQQASLAEAERQRASQKQLADATLVRDRTRQLQKQAAGNAAGRAGTIVTGPLGVPGTPQGAGGKTLLGT